MSTENFTMSPLGEKIRMTKKTMGMPLDDLTVLSAGLDPYRLDTKANHPDGSPYVNDGHIWLWMSQCAKAARFLGYIPWAAVRDNRNTQLTIFTPALGQGSPSTSTLEDLAGYQTAEDTVTWWKWR